MPIPTEPIGSIPRPLRLLDALGQHDGLDPALDPLYEEADRAARAAGGIGKCRAHALQPELKETE